MTALWRAMCATRHVDQLGAWLAWYWTPPCPRMPRSLFGAGVPPGGLLEGHELWNLPQTHVARPGLTMLLCISDKKAIAQFVASFSKVIQKTPSSPFKISNSMDINVAFANVFCSESSRIRTPN